MLETQVKTGLVRFSYPAVFSPKPVGEKGDLKYSISIIIPKKDKATIKAIEAAIEAAYQAGKATLKSTKEVMPKNLKTPLRDGDEREDEDDAYANAYFLTANSNNKPGIVDKYREPITSPDEFYPGCWGRVTLNFFAFNVNGNKGIAVGLNNIQKLKEGERLDGRKNADKDFDDDYADAYMNDDDEDYTPAKSKKSKSSEDDYDEL